MKWKQIFKYNKSELLLGMGGGGSSPKMFYERTNFFLNILPSLIFSSNLIKFNKNLSRAKKYWWVQHLPYDPPLKCCPPPGLHGFTFYGKFAWSRYLVFILPTSTKQHIRHSSQLGFQIIHCSVTELNVFRKLYSFNLNILNISLFWILRLNIFFKTFLLEKMF